MSTEYVCQRVTTRPILAAMDPMNKASAEALGQACLYALQGARQSTALIELLIAKGVVTQQEVELQMRSTENLASSLAEVAAQITAAVEAHDARAQDNSE
jgi:hypothetical protein